MSFRCLILGLALFGEAASGSVFPQSVYLRMSAYRACLVERISPGAGPLQCWQKSVYPVPKGTPEHKIYLEDDEVTDVAVGDMLLERGQTPGLNMNENTCYIKKGQVKCVGPLAPKLFYIFAGLDRVELLAGDNAGFCAYDAVKGIKCTDGRYMGYSYAAPSAIGEGIPDMKQVRLLAVGFAHACAIDAESKLRCWGGALKYPPRIDPAMAGTGLTFRNPTALEIGVDVACALDDDGVKCWGNTKGIPTFDKGVREISLARHRGCVRYDDRVQCWGWHADYVNRTLAKVKRPVALGGNVLAACVVDDEGTVHCASELEYAESIPRKSFELGSLASGLRAAALHVYANRARVLERAAALLDELSTAELGRESTILARLLVMNGLSPFAENIDSDWWQKNFLPAFRELLLRHNRRYGITSLADFPIRPELAKLAIALAESGLRSLATYFGSPEERSAVTDLRAALGKAIATKNAREAGSELLRNSALFEKLRTNPRAKGAAVMLLELGRYLQQPKSP